MVEIFIEASLGNLDASQGLVDAIVQSGFAMLPLEASHAEELRALPWHHREPFDLAQAKVEKMAFLTVDENIDRYEGLILV